MGVSRRIQAETDFDAIVVGSGMSGGWAMKELCELGLKTLVLERGRMVEHGADYPTEHKSPWEMPHRGRIPPDVLARDYPVQRRTYVLDEYSPLNHSRTCGELPAEIL